MRYVIALLMMCAVASGQVGFSNPFGKGYQGLFLGTITSWTNKLNGAKAITICGWAYVDNDFNAVNELTYFTHFMSDNAGLGMSSIQLLTNNTIRVVGRALQTDTARICSATIQRERWFHYAGINDYENARQSVYIDGVLVAQSNSVSWGSTSLVTVAGDKNNSIGVVLYSNGYGFTGKLHDVRTYTRALSSSETSEIYRNPWMHANDPALVLRTCITTNYTGTALSGVARNIGTGPDGTYSNSPTASQPHVQTEKPLTMELP